MKTLTRREYFRANNYHILTWYFITLLIFTLITTISYDFPGAGLIIFNLLPIAAIVLIQILGRKAYRNYVKNQTTEKLKWTDQNRITCVKQRQFLWWKWKSVVHKYTLYAISKFMRSSSTFHVHYKCGVCGIMKTEKFIDPDELILMGISPKELQDIDDENWHYIKDHPKK